MNIAEFTSLLTKTGAPPSPAAIREFEELIGEPLPEEYREFLSQTNGGFIPSPDTQVFVNPRAEAKRNSSKRHDHGPYPQDYRPHAVEVSSVYGLREDPNYSLVWLVENLGVPLQDDLIGIMGDGSGNLICMGISGPARGKVHFRDGGDVYLVTDSFSDFIAGLRNSNEVFAEEK